MSMDNIKKDEASRLPQIVAAVSTTIGSLALGCGLGWTSPTLPNLVDCEDNPDKPEGCSFDHEFTKTEGSWIGSVYTLGALVSGLVTGYLLVKLGRKWTMLLMAVPFITGWLLLALTEPLNLDHPSYFYVGRLLTGFGAGSFALAAPIYIMEISEQSIRGSLGILHQFMVTAGNVFVNGVGSLIQWDILTAIIIVFPVLMTVLMIFMPESPYFLISKNRESKARKNLQWLRGSKYDIDAEIDLLKENEKKQRDIGSIGLKSFLTESHYVKPFLIMMALHFIQQFCGINAIVFYLTDIFLAAGLDIENSLAAAAEVSITQVVATGTAIFLVERMGRKILLIISSSIMCLSIAALGAYFLLKSHIDESCNGDKLRLNLVTASTSANTTCDPEDQDLLDSLGWLPLTSLIVYKFAFSIGYGPLPWMMNGEFFSLEAKSLSASICTAFNWLCAFLVSRFEKDIEDAIGVYGAYFMFAIVCFFATFFAIFFVPETKGKSAEEMKKHFMKQSEKESLDM